MKFFKQFAFALVSVLLLAGIALAQTYRPWVRTIDLTVKNVPVFEAGLGVETSGNIWYVDSSATGTAAGTSWTNACLTVDAAIVLATASNGDVIRVAAAHAENIAAADGFDLDKAGITIFHHGSPGGQATYTYTATDGTIAVGAANCRIFGGRYLAGISAVVIGIAVEAGGDNFTFIDPIFPEPGTAEFEFVDAIDLASGADGFTLINPIQFTADQTGADHFIDAGNGVNNNLTILNPQLYGEYAVAAIWSDTTDLEVLIAGGVITNLTNGQHAIEFVTGTALGTIKDILVRTDVQGTAVDPGSMTLSNVLWSDDAVADLTSTPVVDVELLAKHLQLYMGYELKSIPGSAMPIAMWYVDANISGSGDGKTPGNAFKTIQEAITASSNSVDDWILVFDYSGGGATITMDKAFVHLIGNAANGAMPYPRIKPASAVAGITFAATGDRVEITGFTIGGGDQTVPAISFPIATAAGAYGVHIHDNVIGRDADAPALEGIYVVSGGAAPYLVVENNRFIGAAGSGIAAAGSAIRIAGNATRCQIIGNKILDVGRTATPAIWLDGSVTEPWIEGNMIKYDTDTGTGSAITLGAGVDDGWIHGNIASDGQAAASNNPYVDGGSTNGWGVNYRDKAATLP